MKNRLRSARKAIATYKTWRAEALNMIGFETGKGSWALKPVIKEVLTLPYIGMKWLGGYEA